MHAKLWFIHSVVTHVNLGVIWQTAQDLVQRLVHFFGIALKESTAPWSSSVKDDLPVFVHQVLPPMKSVSPVKTTRSWPSSKR